MTTNEIKALTRALAGDQSIVFAYLFGSRATAGASERSDWDIAVYIAEGLLDANPVWRKFRIEDRVAIALGTDAVEVVILNRVDNPLLAFEIITQGMILVDNDRGGRIGYECRVLGQYHDWQYFMRRHMSSEGYIVSGEPVSHGLPQGQ